MTKASPELTAALESLARVSTLNVSREALWVDNPWRLTPHQAQVMDVLIETGSQKLAAARLGLATRSVESCIARVRWAMRIEAHSHFAHVLKWDRWRRQQTAAAGGTGGEPEGQA